MICTYMNEYYYHFFLLARLFFYYYYFHAFCILPKVLVSKNFHFASYWSHLCTIRLAHMCCMLCMNVNNFAIIMKKCTRHIFLRPICLYVNVLLWKMKDKYSYENLSLRTTKEKQNKASKEKEIWKIVQ